MLDTLDLKQTLDKETYKNQMETLMQQMRSLQYACREQKLPMMVVLEGWAAAGKGALVKKMVNYMDPRGFQVHPIWPASSQERYFPHLWRFWSKLPSYGSIAIFYHSWYGRVLEDRLFDRVKSKEIPMIMSEINAFERQLIDDGMAIAKFWIHLSNKELKSRLKDYAADPLLSWRIRPEDWEQEKHYDEYSKYAQEMLVQTSTGCAPWTLVEGNCQRWSQVKVLTQTVAILKEALDRKSNQIQPTVSSPQIQLTPGEPDFLQKVDLSLSLSKQDYKTQLNQEQVELLKLQLKIHKAKIPVIVLFEGWDAAGKGGVIKRLTDVLDPRSYDVYAFSAPNDEEKAHHYLWRFWRKLPTAGKIAIMDRSWYGRVLVERVEGFANDIEYRRAYQEINEFESQLRSAGYLLVKFWLHISPDEQLKRFEARKNDPFKHHKLTEEDWRNRDKWGLYEVAINQMIQRTHTPGSPWTIISANDKYYARIKVIQTVIESIKVELQ